MPTEKAILLELQYWPPVQYFTKFILYPQVQLEQREHYRKGSYRNRCCIASANGLLRLSVPLMKGKNEQQPIREVRIAGREDWQYQHWKSIRTAYNRSPFFEHYSDTIKPLFQKKYDLLFDLNQEILQTMLSILSIRAEPVLTKTYDAMPAEGIVDFRNGISPKVQYALADPHFDARPYPQVFEEKHGFFPNLSILDLLFCCGPQALAVLKNSIIH